MTYYIVQTLIDLPNRKTQPITVEADSFLIALEAVSDILPRCADPDAPFASVTCTEGGVSKIRVYSQDHKLRSSGYGRWRSR